jgi:hypothetical protein
MAKDTHRVRVWAETAGRRKLVYLRDAERAREGALLAVEQLEQRADVEAIEMEEHVVVRDDVAGERTPEQLAARARRGRRRWERSGDRWKEVSV